MKIDEFNKILGKSLEIIDIGIKKGYFKEEDKETLTNKLIKVVKNGIINEISGTAIYGVYSSEKKKLYYNAKVFKDEQETLIYVLHEMKHALDDYENSIGFELKDEKRIGVGMNEGATQRFATDLTEEIIGEQIPETEQYSLGILLKTNLDEYQIEDKMNELLRKSLNISRADFMKLQNKSDGSGIDVLKQQFDEFADFDTFQNALDEIYYLQEETWLDENKNLLEEEAEPTLEQTERAKKLITICQNEIIKYIEKSNSERLDEIKGDMIMINNTELMNDNDMIMQENYLEYQNFIIEKIKNIGQDIEGEIVVVSGLEPYEYFENLSGTEDNYMKRFLEKGEKLHEKIYIRKENNYFYRDILFDLNGITFLSDEISVTSLEEISSVIENTECIGNEEEYVKLLKVQGKDDKAEEVRKKYEFFSNNRNKIPEILTELKNPTQGMRYELLELARELNNDEGESNKSEEEHSNDDITDDWEEIIAKTLNMIENGEIRTESDGSVHGTFLNDEDFAEVAQNSIKEGDKVRESIKNAIKKEDKNKQEQGE